MACLIYFFFAAFFAEVLRVGIALAWKIPKRSKTVSTASSIFFRGTFVGRLADFIWISLIYQVKVIVYMKLRNVHQA
jgi:hypothetical protein